jgi:preprotein translocase subunit SecA
MLSKVMKSVFGSRNDRIIKKLNQRVLKINQLEASTQALTDAELKQKTEEFKQRHADGETLEQLLDEAFAVCREAAVRTLGMRHYDVQLVGGMILHRPISTQSVARAFTSSPSTTTWQSVTRRGWDRYTVFWAFPWVWY